MNSLHQSRLKWIVVYLVMIAWIFATLAVDIAVRVPWWQLPGRNVRAFVHRARDVLSPIFTPPNAY